MSSEIKNSGDLPFVIVDGIPPVQAYNRINIKLDGEGFNIHLHNNDAPRPPSITRYGMTSDEVVRLVEGLDSLDVQRVAQHARARMGELAELAPELPPTLLMRNERLRKLYERIAVLDQADDDLEEEITEETL